VLYEAEEEEKGSADTLQIPKKGHTKVRSTFGKKSPSNSGKNK